jgi:hypothetical protein
MPTRATPCGGYWAAHYVNRNGDWSIACDALGRIIRCETEKLALSVARYRRRRLRQFASDRFAPEAADEAEAIRLAKQLVDGQDVELWQLDRHIETFRQMSERPIPRQLITADDAR